MLGGQRRVPRGQRLDLVLGGGGGGGGGEKEEDRSSGGQAQRRDGHREGGEGELHTVSDKAASDYAKRLCVCRSPPLERLAELEHAAVIVVRPQYP